VSATRRTRWMRSGLLALVVFALLAFTLHSLRLSDASFTAASNSMSNVFISGDFGHTNNYDKQVMISLTGMKPGSTRTATMTLTGTGDGPGDYTLSVASLGVSPVTSPIAGAVNLEIDDPSGDPLCDDPIGELDTVDLGTIAPNQAKSYDVTLYYPTDYTDGTAQSASLTATLQIEGVSE
jgi:hypothetical protein